MHATRANQMQVIYTTATGCTGSAFCSAAEVPAVLARLLAAGCTVNGIEETMVVMP